jgi:four helix bundle protein
MEVIAICAREEAMRDFRFCNSFRDAAGSVCRNISEGFERKVSGDIVNFFRYALASLAEVQDHLEECRTRSLLDRAGFERLWDLSEHAKATAINFKKVHEKRVQGEANRRPRTRR